MNVVTFQSRSSFTPCDIYIMPGVFPVDQPLPTPFADWAQGLRDGLAALDWEIEWIAGGHGGVAPFADLASHFVES